MFWIVMADESRTSVGHRHPTLESARAEAERLARENRRRFYVLHVVGHAQPMSPPVQWTPDPLATDCDVPGSDPAPGAAAAPEADEACPECRHGLARHTESGCLTKVEADPTGYCPCMRNAAGQLVDLPTLTAAPAQPAEATDLDDLPF